MTARPSSVQAKNLAPGARTLAPMHLSIRVPWHDRGWDGCVCDRPAANVSCLALSRIAADKDDASEPSSKPWNTLAARALPPCATERGAFMAPFEITRLVRHPYSHFSDKHRHFKETRFTHPPYSAACVPFYWMLRSNAEGDAENDIEGLAGRFRLGFNPDIEPELDFDTDWIQHRANQALMLDTFFSAVQQNESLCFFYAKRTPLSDNPRRVIVGVGRVTKVGEPVEYEYSHRSDGDLEGMLWERNITHSIRPGFKDGFIFPYQELLATIAQGEPPDEIERCIAFAPEEHREAFSYASSHVSQDGATASLLSCAAALREIEKRVSGPWTHVHEWISARLAELWKLRGAYPGFASALAALELPVPALLAHEIDLYARQQKQSPFEPWALFEAALEKPGTIPGAALRELGAGFRNVWQQLLPERKALLMLLSRFPLTEGQARRWYDLRRRKDAGIKATDEAILRNPYLLFELDRRQPDAIQLRALDRGLFPDEAILQQFPLQRPSAPSDAADPRRLRAVVCDVLTRSADEEGHTLLPIDWLAERVQRCELDTSCPLSTDYVNAAKATFAPLLDIVPGPDGSEAIQLAELVEAGKQISRVLVRVEKGARHTARHDWRKLVDAVLPRLGTRNNETEDRARKEKAAALEELYASRFSLLLGGAGTGKTTLLKALCQLPEVSQGGILLLAPTGKARVRLERGTGREGGQTIAQFLRKHDRYIPETGAYILSGPKKAVSAWKTVIIDECSMLTEFQLAAVLETLQGFDRLVLAGDPRQLPPIGEGRPFADIAARLQPRDSQGNPTERFPMVTRGYAELTITRRQAGTKQGPGPMPLRDDVRLASWFGGRSVDPAADELWHMEGYDSPHLRLVQWEHEHELHEKLEAELRRELLRLTKETGENGFALSLGGIQRKDGVRFELATERRAGAAESADAWQILSPLRGGAAGCDTLNRRIKLTFRSSAMQAARAKTDRKVPKPLGPQAIVYGDKVISVRNGDRINDWTRWPQLERIYVANGELGIVVGKVGRYPSKMQVEFQSSPGKPLRYTAGEFDADSPVELAYSLTVHKSQGSEFGTTFVVLPYPCALLSRELLYTAFTRHQGRLVLLHQGKLARFREYAEPHASAIARRLTNLFAPPSPFEVETTAAGKTRKKVFLEEKLIHRAENGIRVRSKGELVIAQMLHVKLAGRLRFEYEHPLKFLDGKERAPDFTIWDDDTGRVFYWEHSGFMHDADYRQRWDEKLAGYLALGILPLEKGGGPNGTLIFTTDDSSGGLDAKHIADIIERHILS